MSTPANSTAFVFLNLSPHRGPSGPLFCAYRLLIQSGHIVLIERDPYNMLIHIHLACSFQVWYNLCWRDLAPDYK
jgi:hypothetical protein